jgi:hypothetical protein
VKRPQKSFSHSTDSSGLKYICSFFFIFCINLSYYLVVYG